jgi:hypothetical protein
MMTFNLPKGIRLRSRIKKTGNNLKNSKADKANNYYADLERITAKGEICRYVGIIKRKD